MCIKRFTIIILLFLGPGLVSCGSFEAQPGIPAILFFQELLSVLNPDNYGVTIAQTGSGGSVTEGAATDTYTVVFNQAPKEDTIIEALPDSQLTVNGSSLATNLTFTTNDWNVPQTLTVAAVDDSVAEGSHTGIVSHSVISGDSNYTALTLDSLSFIITDNDTPGVSITEPSGGVSVNEGAASATDTYSVVLTSAPVSTVTITIVNDASQVTLNTNTLTFTSSDWNVSQDVVVTPVDDSYDETQPHLTTITHTASGDVDYAGIAINDVVASITDNDSAGVQISTSSVSVEEGVAGVQYGIVLTSQPLDTVTVSISGDAQISLSDTSLDFTTANWDQTQYVTVTAVDDADVEGLHSSTVTHTAASIGDLNYDGIAVASVSVSITDNDFAYYTIGGSVSGLTGSGLILQNNSGDDLTVSAPTTSFTFATSVIDGGSYAVTVLTQPFSPDQTCSVSSGSGTVSGANVTSVGVTCTAPQTIDDGSLVTDPFGEGGSAVSAANLYVYNDKLYIGPNDTEDAVYEMSFDMASTVAVDLDADGSAGAPYTSFAGLIGASGVPLAGIDSFYAACTGVSPPTLTGTSCSGAGGTEYSFIAGFQSSGGGYQSIWMSSDTGSVQTYTEVSGFEAGPGAYRSMSMSVFKDQLYVAIQDQGGGAPKLSRSCMKSGGCDNGDLYKAITKLGGSSIPYIGKGGTPANGAAGLASIDSMWEYDNDGTGSNASQLYIANGGALGGGVLPSSTSILKDGGVVRTKLASSTTSGTPSKLPTVADHWENITPTAGDWVGQMSIALPADASTGGDWDALVPANKITPAIKAIPYMRTAPNGDLYLIRNACSSVTVHSVASGNFVSNGSQTCPQGNEVPQLWMLPKGTSGAPKGSSDWIHVADAGISDRTDLSGNAACISGVNRCDTENTHITLLEFNGNYLYIGYDNATYGANLWRVDMSAVSSGTAPAESDFALVSTFGLGDAVNNTRFFAHVTANDGGTDYLYLLAGNGTNALRLFRTNNN